MRDDEGRKAPGSTELDGKLNAASGGLLLIWVGIALLADLGWGTGLIGVGTILLAEQAARRYYAVQFASFWVVVGTVAVVGGGLTLVVAEASLVPILLIGIGIVLLASAVRGRHKEGP